ncbi:MAG: AbrB/MazE/SpoVT family DNA-binding domain-containing protein [Candidatus Micrarchaeota archaeon]|nr:AbrB/MazE/SpoVT family DNA-binding domain-containing protein [Candidatus Micrarchaeota archaeon]
MDVEIIKMSSRGQFVLPLSMRRRYRIGRGEKLMLVDNDGTIVLRPVRRMKADIDDELCLMQKAASAWGDIERGKARKMPKKKFLKELASW